MEKRCGEDPTAPGAVAGESVGYATWHMHKVHKAIQSQEVRPCRPAALPPCLAWIQIAAFCCLLSSFCSANSSNLATLI